MSVESEKPSRTSGSELEREVDPNSPEHKDAGQLLVDEPNQGREEAERMAEERAKEADKEQ